MRLFLLTTLTMVAFAANSILNRMALSQGGIDAGSFGSARLVAGAVMLAILCVSLRGDLRLGGPGRAIGVAALLLYIYGFSTAYNELDAGLGALILFGVVQITMFAGGILAGETMPPRRWIGAALAFGGLSWLLWPGGRMPISTMHTGLMAAAGVGWGLYSLTGKQSTDALQSTAANFILAAPIGIALGLVLPTGTEGLQISTQGIVLAFISGAITSGMGYALWYSVLPKLTASVAAVAQLTVPIIAMVGGLLLLNEAMTLQFVLASALVLGGVAVSVLPFKVW